MSGVTHEQLRQAITEHEDMKDALDESGNVRDRFRKYCTYLLAALGDRADETVDLATLINFDILLADQILAQLEARWNDCVNGTLPQQDPELAARLAREMSVNRVFRNGLLAKSEKLSDMTPEDQRDATEIILADALEVPDDIAASCVEGSWTLGQLMAAHPPFFVRNLLDG